MTAVEVCAALLVPLIWGVQFVTTKFGVDQMPPLFFVTLRFLCVTMLLLPFLRRPTRRELASAALISVFFGSLGFGLFFGGLSLGSAGLSAVISQLTTPFTVLLCWPILGERPALGVGFGLIVAIAGIAIALTRPGDHMPFLAVLLLVGAALAQAIGNALIKRLGPLNPLRLMAWLSLLTVPQVGVASLVLERGQSAALFHAGLLTWLSLAYTVILGAIVGFGLWFWLIARCSLSRVAPFALLQTVFAIAAGIVVLHEHVTPSLLGGALICTAGVALTQLHGPRGHGRPHHASQPG